MGKQHKAKTKPPPLTQDAIDKLADNVADHDKPLSLWPLTLDQAVSIALTAPPLPKRSPKDPKDE